MRVMVMLVVVGLVVGCGGAKPTASVQAPAAPRFKPVVLKTEPRYLDKPLSRWVALADDANSDLRNEAFKALGAIGEPSLPHLNTLAHSKNKLRRQDAFGVMMQIGKPSVPLLLDLLDDPDAEVRREAAVCLAWTVKDDRSSVPFDSPDSNKAIAILREASKQDDFREKATSGLAILMVP